MQAIKLPKQDAPPAPIGQDTARAGRELAPWPQIDRYPTIIGQGASLAYASAVFRNCLIGYRQPAVDFLAELLEKDGHLFSTLEKMILTVAGGRVEMTPATLPAKSPATDTEQAQEISDACDFALGRIPDLEQHLASLAWALYYGLTGAENHWDKSEGQWSIARLSKIHSRRLSYPDQYAWDLYIWDQGGVIGPFGTAPTNGVLGLRVADFPGKFTVHVPDLRGDYPTRDGLGRIAATWTLLKLIASRGGGQYLERFAKPWPEVSYKTDDGTEIRKASKEDINDAIAAMRAMGAGSLQSWVHADSLTLKLLTPDNSGATGKLTYKEWLEYCNSEISKLVLGATLTTEVGSTGGNRALGSVHESAEMRLAQYHADTIAATLKRDILTPFVRLNFGESALKFLPNLKIHVGAEPDPNALVERASKAASAGIHVDGDAVAEQAGLPVVPPSAEDAGGRRMFPLKQMPADAYDPELADTSREISKANMDAMPPPATAPNGATPGKPASEDKSDATAASEED